VAEVLSDRLVPGPAREIVVATRARRLGDDLQLAGVGLELEHRPTNEIAFQHHRLAVRAASVQVAECQPEAAHALGMRRGADVHPVGDLTRPLQHATECTDHHIRHQMLLERPKQPVRIELALGSHLRASRLEHRLEALLRRPRKLLAQAGIVALVWRLVEDELHVEIEAAGLQHLA